MSPARRPLRVRGNEWHFGFGYRNLTDMKVIGYPILLYIRMIWSSQCQQLASMHSLFRLLCCRYVPYLCYAVTSFLPKVYPTYQEDLSRFPIVDRRRTKSYPPLSWWGRGVFLGEDWGARGEKKGELTNYVFKIFFKSGIRFNFFSPVITRKNRNLCCTFRSFLRSWTRPPSTATAPAASSTAGRSPSAPPGGRWGTGRSTTARARRATLRTRRG